MKQVFLDLGLTPLADKFVTQQQYYPLAVSVDTETWMVELEGRVPDDQLFGSDYDFFTGSSPALVKYFTDYAMWVKLQFPREVAQDVVEIACNDGTLLQHFADAVGIDPAGPPVKAALAHGLSVVNAPFSSSLAHEMFSAGFAGGGVVIANNVVAHVQDLDDFIHGVRILMGTSGVAIIEFQYLENLLNGNEFPLFYHEHRRYLSITSLSTVLHRWGLQIVDFVPTPTQGGSLRCVIRRKLNSISPKVALLWRSEEHLRKIDTYEAFSSRIHQVKSKLHDVVQACAKQGSVALWGAPAKATTLIHACELQSYIDFAEDLTPAKIGKVMPGTNIPIVKPGTREAHTYLLGSYNYAHRALQFPGSYIVPVPDPALVIIPE